MKAKINELLEIRKTLIDYLSDDGGLIHRNAIQSIEHMIEELKEVDNE